MSAVENYLVPAIKHLDARRYREAAEIAAYPSSRLTFTRPFARQ